MSTYIKGALLFISISILMGCLIHPVIGCITMIVLLLMAK